METLDGKFKTKAKTVEDALKEMQEMIDSLVAAMQGYSNPVPSTGRPMFFSLDGNGGGGHNNHTGNNRNNKRDNEGTGKPNLSSGDLGELLGSGGNKNVYAYGEDKAVGVLKDGKPQKLITEELGLLNKLDELGLPTVNGRSIFVDGKDALMFDRFAQGSKDIVKLHDGKVQIVGESSLLNQRSIEDLTAIRKIMVEKKIKINDLQFLIGKDGRVVVADPLNVEVGKKVKPSKNNLRMIDLLIESARKNSK